MLHVHRSHRTEALVERLASLVNDQPSPDPMQAELLMVGSRGMERWLATELARRSPVGIVANLVVDFPQAFVDRLVDDVLGRRDPTLVDPWSTDALVWTIAGRLPDAIAGEPRAFPQLARYLDVQPHDSPDPVDDGSGSGQMALLVDTDIAATVKVVDRKLLGFAGQLADMFDRYALYRPSMVNAWRTERDVDADGKPLGDQRWQALVWRAVASQQRTAASPAHRIADAVARLADGHQLSPAVPSRLAAFGVSTLPPLHLELLAEVARQREVHLMVPSPSPTLWQLGWDGDTTTQPVNAMLRAAGPVGRHVGQLVRAVAAVRGTDVVDDEWPGGDPSAAVDDTPWAGTLLGRLQHDIVTDTALPEEPDGMLRAADGDRSIVFHDGHGAVRQVEALQDELLRRFDADPTLHPREVVVLTPDLQTYAPLVQAVFADPLGRFPSGRPTASGDVRDADDVAPDPPTIPIAIADGTAGRGNPVASVLVRSLSLVHARASGAEVLDLLSTEPVRARFRVTPGELVTVQQWLEDTGVAWARDEQDRRFHRQPARREHTWAAAVDRLLVGVAMADEDARTVGGVVPYDPVEDRQDLDLLDRLTQFLDVVDELVECRRERSLTEWAERLGRLLDELTGPVEGLQGQDEAARDDHRRDRERVDAVLGQLDRAHDALGRDVEVRALARWLDRALDAASGSGGHGTGAVTVAELVPLRAIPFRVVCLLGMDTGSFPRRPTQAAHDLVARDPRPGDRDRRAEDRALFLDAIHAAQEALVVTHAGRDPVTGREQPPAVPVAELRDAVESYVGRDGLRRRTTVHPVLPTGPSGFAADGPTSYDRVRLAAARAAQDQQLRPPPFLDRPLPDDEVIDEVLPLDQLVRVVSKPAAALLARLRVARPQDLRTFPETEPLALDPLTNWQVGEALLAAVEDGGQRDLDGRVAVVLARGRRPAGAVGRHEVRPTLALAQQMVACLDRLGPREDRHVALDVAGRRVEGRLRLAVGERTQVVVSEYGTNNGKRVVRAWLRHLVACAALPDETPRTVFQFREGSRTDPDVGTIVFPVLPSEVARTELRRWIELHDRARCERVPFVATVSWTYAALRDEAERIAIEEGGADPVDVAGMDEAELLRTHGDVAMGRSTVASTLARAREAAHTQWGREDDAQGWPEREQPEMALVFRDLQRWDDLHARTDLTELAISMLRPLARSIDAGAAEADGLCP